MKDIIVNCAKDKKTIVVVEDGNLIEKYEEYNELQRLEGNIYLGKITDILPGMQAAFVDIGDEKNAFLHIKDVLPKASEITGNKNEKINKNDIKKYKNDTKDEDLETDKIKIFAYLLSLVSLLIFLYTQLTEKVTETDETLL